MKKTMPHSELGWPGIGKISHFIKHAPIRIARLLVAFALLGCFSSTAFCQTTKLADDSTVSIVLGDPRIQRPAEFRVPRRYDPEIVNGYRFRLVLDYPSMQTVARPRDFRTGDKLLDVQVEAYPRNGTMADRVVDGSFGAKKMGEENGYVIYSQPLGKTSKPKKVFAYLDSQGNNVIVEDPGEWSIRYQMTHGIKPYYVITCFFSKKMNVDFRQIDDAVLKLVSEMYVK